MKTDLFGSVANPVPLAFARILGRAALTIRDNELYEQHRLSVSGALKGKLDVNEVIPIGSFPRGSAIHGTSDIDLLVMVPKKSLQWGGAMKSSTTVLAAFRSALQDRFSATSVGKDGQAVVVAFGDGQHPVDVVPAYWDRHGGIHNYPIYRIPDGSGDWMDTSPTSHARFINDADGRAGGKLKYTAQVFKAWRQSRAAGVPLSGFHVEMLLANERICEGARSYSAIFRDLLVVLANRGGGALNDPVAVSGRIAIATTDTKREQALRTVRDAASHADAAVDAEVRGHSTEALRQWNLAFNGVFPG